MLFTYNTGSMQFCNTNAGAHNREKHGKDYMLVICLIRCHALRKPSDHMALTQIREHRAVFVETGKNQMIESPHIGLRPGQPGWPCVVDPKSHGEINCACGRHCGQERIPGGLKDLLTIGYKPAERTRSHEMFAQAGLGVFMKKVWRMHLRKFDPKTRNLRQVAWNSCHIFVNSL